MLLEEHSFFSEGKAGCLKTSIEILSHFYLFQDYQWKGQLLSFISELFKIFIVFFRIIFPEQIKCLISVMNNLQNARIQPGFHMQFNPDFLHRCNIVECRLINKISVAWLINICLKLKCTLLYKCGFMLYKYLSILKVFAFLSGFTQV